MPARPLVSVCVPTRNRATLLAESLPTILGQDYAPLEILISDNASTDGTEALCRDLVRRDRRVRYVRHEQDIGLYGNHNYCLDESGGEFIGLWHDDDIRDSTLASRCVEFLTSYPTVGVVSADYVLIDDDGQIIGARDRNVPAVTPGLEYIRRTYATGSSSVGIPGALIRRSALKQWRFEEHGPTGFADFVLWCQIAEQADVGHLNERLWTYRLHRRSLSRRKLWDSVQDYEFHLGGYCAAHLTRYPEHRALVARWRESLNAFLFWALAYEIGAHVGTPGQTSARAYRSVFEIANYNLEPREIATILDLMRHYRRGLVRSTALVTLEGMLRLHVTSPLRWVADRMAARRNGAT